MIPKYMLHEPDETKLYMQAAQRLVDRGEIVTQEAIYEEALSLINGATVKHRVAEKNWLGEHIAWLELHTTAEIDNMVAQAKLGILHSCEKCK